MWNSPTSCSLGERQRDRRPAAHAEVEPAGTILSAAQMGGELARVKWLLWHGHVFHALQVLDDLEFDLDGEQDPSPAPLWTGALGSRGRSGTRYASGDHSRGHQPE
jgi:hypothetical protein